MRNFLFFFSAVLLSMIITGCDKESGPEIDPEKSSEPTARLISITGTQTYTPGEFIDKLANSTYASWLGLEEYLEPVLKVFVAERQPELWSIFAKETLNLSPVNWQVEQVNFDYKTVDVKGDSAIMSGMICFPDNTIGKEGHELSSISLVGHTFLSYNTDCPTIKGDILMGRALWNSLVVIPDMQGFGSSKDLGDAMRLSRSSANQIVDCERVAIDIVKSLGFTFAEDYYTNVMGCSLGGGSMMGVARLMEECSAKDQSLFKYNSAFVAEGVYSFFDFVADYMRNGIKESGLQSTGLPIITFQAKGMELGGYSSEDFWTPQYTTVLGTIEGRQISPATYSFYHYDENDDVKVHKAKFTEFFSSPEALEIFPEDMNSSSLILDPSIPKTKAFKDFCDKEIPYTDWTPSHRITIYHAENDEWVPFFLATDAYNALKNNGGGDNVILKSFAVPEISFLDLSPHYVGTALAEFRMLINEDPSVVYDCDALDSVMTKMSAER